MTADTMWHSTLSELQLQMTRATFDSWLRPTRAVALEGDELVVRTHSPYAKEWLENRLQTTIERTVTGIAGRSMQIRYVVTPDAPAALASDEPSGCQAEESGTAEKPDKIEAPEHRWFVMLPNLLDDSDLDPFELRLLVHYLRRGTCWESVRTTAKATRMSPSQVERVRERLKEKRVAGEFGGVHFEYDTCWIAVSANEFGTLTVRIVDIWPQNVAFYSGISAKKAEEAAG